MSFCSNAEGQTTNPEHAPVALLAEASPQIGTGHVVETFSIARTARRCGIPVKLWVNKGTPGKLLDLAPDRPEVTDDFSPKSLQQLAGGLWWRGCSVAVTSFRRITNQQVNALRQAGIGVACIDELGNVKLDCDVVINPSIVTKYHRYTSDNPRFRVWAGPQYMPLSEEYSELHQQPRSFTGDIRNIVIAMGGTDRSGATLRIVESLLNWRRDVTKHVVVGAGFVHMAELDSRLSAVEDVGFVVHRNLGSLANLLTLSDVGFTAGGNTLYELACLGTPAVVLFEDPHEREQSLAFQERGFGTCLGSGVKVTKNQIWAALDALESPEQRQSMCEAGRSLVDGKGTERILKSVLEIKRSGFFNTLIE